MIVGISFKWSWSGRKSFLLAGGVQTFLFFFSFFFIIFFFFIPELELREPPN